MAYKIDIKCLIIGLLAGIIVLLVLGAASGRNEGTYQLSIAAVRSEAAGGSEYVIYGRIHTGTGKIETWKYMLNSRIVPHLGNDERILLGPEGKSPNY